MSLSVLGMGGRTPMWQRQHRPQPPPGGGPANGAPPKAPVDEVSTSTRSDEQARTEVAALNQAIWETEQGLALVSTARHGLEAVLHRLNRMAGAVERALAGRTGGTGLPSAGMWDEVVQALRDDGRAIDNLARDTRFGDVRLLDGSCGCRGAAFGPWLEFVSAGSQVRSSPPEGFPVVLTQEPTRAAVLGDRSLTPERIAAGENLAVEADGQWVEVRTGRGQTFLEVVQDLNDAIARKGLPLAVLPTSSERLLVHHCGYGSARRFRVRSSTPGILSGNSSSSGPWGDAIEIDNGRDVVGTINGEPAEGREQTLIGLPGNRTTAGLVVRYTGTPPPGFEAGNLRSGGVTHCPHAAPRDGWKNGWFHAGRVLVVQRSLSLRGGEGEFVLRLDSIACTELGRNGSDTDGIACVADTLSASPAEAERVMAVLKLAQARAAKTLRAAAQAEEVTLAGYLAKLRVESENRLATHVLGGSPGDTMAWVASLGDQLRAEGLQVLRSQRPPRPTILLRLLHGSGENGPDEG